MTATASKRARQPVNEAPRRISELEPSTQRSGNYIEILGDFKPLSRDFVPSNLAKDSKKPVR